MEIERYTLRFGESKKEENNNFQTWFMILLALLIIGDTSLL
jgi:hypothetical protein